MGRQRALRHAIAGMVILIVALTVRPASAQCGAKRSTCSACHDGASAPLPSSSPWHRDHAFADVCAVCHGGAPDAKEPALAHEGRSAPLGAAGEPCVTCHGSKSAELAARYRAACASDAGAIVVAASVPMIPLERHGRSGPNLVAVFVAGTLALVGSIWVFRGWWIRERKSTWD